MKIIISSNNPSKIEQIKAILNNPAIELVTLAEACIEGEAVEDGTTLEENAWKKAMYARENSSEKIWALADDTGLFIAFLNGAPGIHAARWAGINATTEEITQHTIDMMKGAIDRSAYFETGVVLISPAGERYYFNGRINGWMAEYPKAKAQPKMPYSGLFSPEGSDKVWAEMTVNEENAISHRGKAFRKAKAFLEAQL